MAKAAIEAYVSPEDPKKVRVSFGWAWQDVTPHECACLMLDMKNAMSAVKVSAESKS
jgi:hypothetical protein